MMYSRPHLRRFAATFALALIGLLGLAPAVRAQGVIGTYTFTGAAGNEPTFPVDVQPTNAVFGAFGRGPGITPSGSVGRFSSTGFTTATTIDLTQYYTFAVTANMGFQLNLDSLTFTERRSATGVSAYQVRSSVDNFATAIVTVPVPDDTNIRPARIGLSGAAFDGLSTIEFRIYGYGAEAVAGTWRLDDVRLVGTVAPSGPPTPTFAFGAAQTVSESVGTVTIPVTLTNPGSTAATVDVVLGTPAGTATAGTDYILTTPQTLTFAPGTTTQNVTLTVIDDTQQEVTETVIIKLQNPSTGAALGAAATFTLSITDNDTPPPPASVQFSFVSQSVAESAGTLQVGVTLTNPGTTAVTVQVMQSGGTATVGTDYTFTGQTLAFAPGTTTQNAALTIIDDTQQEPAETVLLMLMNATGNATIGTPGTFTLTILDNDGAQPAPVVAFSAATQSVAESAGAIQVPVTLTNPGTTAVTVQVMQSGGTATAGTDYTFTGQTLTFAPGTTTQNAALTIIDDTQQEPGETVVLMLMNATGGATIGTTSTFTLTITDNDTSGPLTPPLTTIAAVTVNDAAGAPMMLGQAVRVRGVVTGPNIRTTGYQTSLQDAGRGIGLFRSMPIGTQAINQGDSLEVIGIVSQFNGLTQITIDSFRTRAVAQRLPTPRPITVLDETTESLLVHFTNGPFTLVDPAQWTNTMSGFTADITNGTTTYALRIVRGTDVYGSNPPTQPFNLTGIGGQFDNASPFDSGYQIIPRALTDIEIVTGTAGDLALAGLTLSPNPATNLLTIRSTTGQEALVYNLLGQFVLSAKLVAGTATVRVDMLPAGVYMVRVGNAAQRFLKQ